MRTAGTLFSRRLLWLMAVALLVPSEFVLEGRHIAQDLCQQFRFIERIYLAPFVSSWLAECSPDWLGAFD